MEKRVDLLTRAASIVGRAVIGGGSARLLLKATTDISVEAVPDKGGAGPGPEREEALINSLRGECSNHEGKVVVELPVAQVHPPKLLGAQFVEELEAWPPE